MYNPVDSKLIIKMALSVFREPILLEVYDSIKLQLHALKERSGEFTKLLLGDTHSHGSAEIKCENGHYSPDKQIKILGCIFPGVVIEMSFS